jgi:hypothetical protein
VALDSPQDDSTLSPGISRRTVVKATAWSVPIIAAAVSAPALAASGGTTARLTYSVTPLVDVYAPYGTQSILVTNTTGVDFSGELVFSTPEWSSTAPFELAGATMTGGTASVWTIPNASIPANDSASFALTWPAGYPVTAEQQPLTVTADPTLAIVSPSGDETIFSPYQLLWYAVTPGGQGNPSGTPGFFIGNTTGTDFASANTDIRMGVWSFPIAIGYRINVDGTSYNGARIAENGTFVFLYNDVPTAVPADGGRLDIPFEWTALGGSIPVAQQQRQLFSIIPDPAVPMATLGSLTIYSISRP